MNIRTVVGTGPISTSLSADNISVNIDLTNLTAGPFAHITLKRSDGVAVLDYDDDVQNITISAPVSFRGGVGGLTQSTVGLNAVNNTSDVDKPISTATQNALNLLAPKASPSFTGGAAFTGALTMPGYMFCAGVISSAGAKLTGTGQVGFSSAPVSTGIYQITFSSAHPLGTGYIVDVTGQGGVALVRGSNLTSTSFNVTTYAIGTSTSTNFQFHFMVLAS